VLIIFDLESPLVSNVNRKEAVDVKTWFAVTHLLGANNIAMIIKNNTLFNQPSQLFCCCVIVRPIAWLVPKDRRNLIQDPLVMNARRGFHFKSQETKRNCNLEKKDLQFVVVFSDFE
jgi:hypothetical protein